MFERIGGVFGLSEGWGFSIFLILLLSFVGFISWKMGDDDFGERKVECFQALRVCFAERGPL